MFIDYAVHLRSCVDHPKQELLVNSTAKRIIVRAGRRGGKTTAAAKRCVKSFLKGRRVLYAVPTSDQLKKWWYEVVRALKEPLEYGVYRKNETEHYIELSGTQQRIRGKTAWNADTLRGDYADDLVLDEYQLMSESTWGDVGAPMLLDNNGDALFIYTPPSLHARKTAVSKAKDIRHAAKMFKAAQEDKSGRWLAIHFTSHENPNISEQGLQEITFDMTALSYKQEILAEDVTEVPGALWKLDMIEKLRVAKHPELTRIVVAVDPSGSSTNEAGIVAAGLGVDGHAYVLKDASILAPSPKAWATATVATYDELSADRVVGERNYGGDMVKATIQGVDENVSYKDVIATRGKMVRAEPICALYEKGIVHHVGQYPELEEEMCVYVPGNASPNRMDACFVAGTRILTTKGEIPIEEIAPGMLVATRVGWKPVARSGSTGIRRIVSRFFPNGRRLTGTADHRVFTFNRGFVAMDALCWYDMIALCIETSGSSGASASFAIRRAGMSRAAAISRAPFAGKAYCCTGRSGSPPMARFRRATTFITSTGTRSTTNSPISSACLKKSMPRDTAMPAANGGDCTWRESDSSPRCGIAAKPDSVGTASTPGKHGASGRGGNWADAWHAAKGLSAFSTGKTSAAALASAGTPMIGTVIAGELVARPAMPRSGRANIARGHPHVRENAHGSFAEVFNLEVAEQPEYFANGVLVHNCVWALTDLLGGRHVLGLMEYSKSGQAEKDLKEAEMNKAESATTLQKPTMADETPRCPKCSEKVALQRIAGGQLRCAQCGEQFDEKGREHEKPNLPKLDRREF